MPARVVGTAATTRRRSPSSAEMMSRSESLAPEQKLFVPSTTKAPAAVGRIVVR
jgi:hypothetical protein